MMARQRLPLIAGFCLYPLLAVAEPMTDAEAKAVCEEIAAIDSRGAIQALMVPTGERVSLSAEPIEGEVHHDGQLEKRFTLDLHPGQPSPFGVFMSSGTCVSFTV